MAATWQAAFGAIAAEFLGRKQDGSYELPTVWDGRDTLPVDVQLEQRGVAQKFLNASYIEMLEEILVLIVRTEALAFAAYAIENGRSDLTTGGA